MSMRNALSQLSTSSFRNKTPAASESESEDEDPESTALVQKHYSLTSLSLDDDAKTDSVPMQRMAGIEMMEVQQKQEYHGHDILCKVVMFGDSGVGKTQFAYALTRTRTETVKELMNSISTIGVDFACHHYLVADTDCLKAQLWDTAGQERFSNTPATYCRNANVIIVFYDTTSVQSFQSIGRRFLPDIENTRASNPDLVVALVGTKTDLVNKRTVSRVVAQQYVDMNSFNAYFELSNLARLAVHESFERIIGCAYSKLLKNVEKERVELLGSNIDYAVYQFVCGLDGSTPERFERALATALELQRDCLLASGDPTKAVSVTINSIVHSRCLYLNHSKATVFENVAVVQVSVNPSHVSTDGVPAVKSAGPYAAFLAEEMRREFRQHVVPISAVSPASSVFAATGNPRAEWVLKYQE